jgi:hypothetical protein
MQNRYCEKANYAFAGGPFPVTYKSFVACSHNGTHRFSGTCGIYQTPIFKPHSSLYESPCTTIQTKDITATCILTGISLTYVSVGRRLDVRQGYKKFKNHTSSRFRIFLPLVRTLHHYLVLVRETHKCQSY